MFPPDHSEIAFIDGVHEGLVSPLFNGIKATEIVVSFVFVRWTASFLYSLLSFAPDTFLDVGSGSAFMTVN